MTDWMKSVQVALKTIPKNTPNRLGAAMKKAKLTYKKKGSSSAASSSSVMKKTFKRRRGPKGKGSRKSKRSRRPRQSGGLNYDVEELDDIGRKTFRTAELK